MKRYESVDDYIDNTEQWSDELRKLRAILTSTPLTETVKWGGPCYTFDGKNVIGMGAFKSYFGLWFFQGALLKDTAEVLINAQEGRTKALRQWRMHSRNDIKTRLIKSYVNEAISLQAQGLEIKPDRDKSLEIPPQLKSALSKDKKAKASFKEMSKGKKREYVDYIASAKREDTKAKRLEKILPMIAEGKGLHDQYRNC